MTSSVLNKLTDSWKQDKLVRFRTKYSFLMQKSKEELIEMMRTGDEDIYKVLQMRTDKFIKMYAKVEKDPIYRAYAKGNMLSVWSKKDIRWNYKLHGMLPDYDSWHYANRISILIDIGIEFAEDGRTKSTQTKHKTIVNFLMKSRDNIMGTNKK